MIQLIFSFVTFVLTVFAVSTVNKGDTKKTFWTNRILKSSKVSLAIDTDVFLLVLPKVCVSVTPEECLLTTQRGVFDVSNYRLSFVKKAKVLYQQNNFFDMRYDDA